MQVKIKTDLVANRAKSGSLYKWFSDATFLQNTCSENIKLHTVSLLIIRINCNSLNTELPLITIDFLSYSSQFHRLPVLGTYYDIGNGD